jgi:drug/metabolite transporter (DMT)-like permease
MISLPFSKNEHNQAIVALIIANIIWGAASPIFKLALQNIPPFTLAYLRFMGASLLLFPFAFKNLWIDRKDWFNLLLLSIFGITINITFFFFGLKYAPSINAPIVASSGPVLGYIGSIFLLHEKPHFKVLIGMVVSLIGVLIIVGQPLLDHGMKGEILGNLFFVLAMLGAVGHSILAKKVMPKYPTVTTTFWSFLIGGLTFFPFFVHDLFTLDPFSYLDYRGIIGLVFGIFLSSALAYYLFDWGIKKINAQEIGLFTYIDPIIAIIIAMPLLGEKLSPVFILGSIFVFFGIFIAEGRLHYHPFHKLKE